MTSHGEEPTETHQLREAQTQREREEQELLERSDQADEAAQHRRRRDKAEYLKEKLAEREEAEEPGSE